jgi:hypothetical protein
MQANAVSISSCRRVSANGGGDDVGSRCDDVPLAASRSSCKGFRARSSDNLRSDRTGRTSLDW